MERIGELLRMCRERAGLTQQQLADKLCYERSTIAKIESGAIQYPSYAIVKSWAKATNSEDIISLDIYGKDAWQKMRRLEQAMTQIKTALEAVNFLKRKVV